jgi:hypothetical protein
VRIESSNLYDDTILKVLSSGFVGITVGTLLWVGELLGKNSWLGLFDKVGFCDRVGVGLIDGDAEGFSIILTSVTVTSIPVSSEIIVAILAEF